MKVDQATVLITGANRGLGLALTLEALSRGARKVYAAAREPSKVTLPGVVPVRLDVTNTEDIAAVAHACGDVTLLVNNAGIAEPGGFFGEDALASAQRHLDTNLFGPMRLTRAFAPILAANGGGGIVNVLSIASWINGPILGNYAMSKSAAWALTNGTRIELAEHNTQVLALHVGFIDTGMVRRIDAPKSAPSAVARITFDALETGASEVLADDFTRQVHARLSTDPAVYLHAINR